MNIILANCVVKNGNRGCVALTLTTMYLLDKILKEAGVSYTFYLPQSGFSGFGTHKIKTPFMEFEYETITDISLYNNNNIKTNIIHFKDFVKSRQIIKDCDYILDIGQGDSFADIYGKNRFGLINGQHTLGHKYDKPYCILPQTIGPFKYEKIKRRAFKSISWAQCVMVRDKQSYDFVKNNMPNTNINLKEIIDVAFFMPYKKKDFDSNYVHVGLNISSLLWHGGYTGNNQFGLKDDYKTIIRKITEYFLSQNNVKVHLIPHVVGSERHVENDYAVCYDLTEEIKNENLILAPLFLDPIAAKGYIAGMDFFMGARMHSTIAAFSSGVPVVPMAYSRKFNGLFVDTLQYPYIVDLKEHFASDIFFIIKNVYKKRQELKNIIYKRMNGIVEERKKILIKELKIFLNL